MTSGRDAVVAGVYATEQSVRSGRTSESFLLEALHGALNDAGVSASEIDGFASTFVPDGSGLGVTAGNVASFLGQPLAFVLPYLGPQALAHAASMIRCGLANVVALAHGYSQPQSGDAVYTTPSYEYTDWTGSFTAAQFALLAKRHMHVYGTTAEQLAHGSALVRNEGSNNPSAVKFDAGRFSSEDVLNSPMIADPLTRLMCSLVNDGGSCVIVTTADRAKDCRHKPIRILGGQVEQRYSTYYNVPRLLTESTPKKMQAALQRSGLARDDVDAVQIYDHFSIGIPMSLEALGFCELGEGGPFVAERCGRGPGRLPITTDGGCHSHSHNGNPYNHRIIEAVRQLRGDVLDRCGGSATHRYDDGCRRVREAEVMLVCGPLTGVFSFALLAR